MGVAATGARNANAFAGAALRGTKLPDEHSITYEGVFNENVYKLEPANPDKLVSTEVHHARCLNPFTGTLETWIGCYVKSNRDGAPRDDTPIDISIALDISESMIVGMGLSKASLFEQRLFRENAATGPVQYSLIWNTRDDLDLHCIPPGGGEISYQQRTSPCGGALDVDMNAGSPSSQEPVENIFWSLNPPTGHFKVFVENYSYKQTLAGEPVPFTLRLKLPNQEIFFEGECVGTGKDSTVSFDFDYLGPEEMIDVDSITFGTLDSAPSQQQAEVAQKTTPANRKTPVHVPDLKLYTGKESRLLYAKECINKLLTKLRPNDRFGIAAFTEIPTLIQPLQLVSELNRDDVLASVNALKPSAGTTLQAGMEAAASMFREVDDLGPRHKRIVLITDMDDMNASELDKMVEDEARGGVYCSIVGLGVDFNSELAETVSKNRGGNYFTVTTPEELEKTVVTDFQWTFFPCAFDVSLDLMQHGLFLKDVYGTPYDTSDVVPAAQWKPSLHHFYPDSMKESTITLLLCAHRKSLRLPMTCVSIIMDYLETLGSKVTEVNTVFPSHATPDGSVEGGLLLMRLSTQPDAMSCAARLAMTYTNPTTDCTEVYTECVQIASDATVEHYSHSSMLQALLLQRYVETCKAFLIMAAKLDWKMAVPEDEVRKLYTLKGLLHDQEIVVGPQVIETYDNFLKTVDKFVKDQNAAAAAHAGQGKQLDVGQPMLRARINDGYAAS